MKIFHTVVVIFATNLVVGQIFADDRSVEKNDRKSFRDTRQTQNADQMVQNILKWLQGVYTQQSRRSRFADDFDRPLLPFNEFASARIDNAFRQGTIREYLPPTNTEKPRPFEPRPSGDGTDDSGNFVDGGYPPAGISPQPPFPIYTNPASGGITAEGYPSPSGPAEPSGITSTLPPPSLPTGYPAADTTPRRPGFPTGAPPGFTGYPTERPRPEFPTSEPTGFTGYPSAKPSYTPGIPTQPPGDGYTYPTQANTEGTPYPTPPFPTRPPNPPVESDGPRYTEGPQTDGHIVSTTGRYSPTGPPSFSTHSPSGTPEATTQPSVTIFDILGSSTQRIDSSPTTKEYLTTSQPAPDVDTAQPSLVTISEIPEPSTPWVELDNAATEPQGSSTSSQLTPDGDTVQPSLGTVSEIPQPSIPSIESDNAVTEPQGSSTSSQPSPDSDTTQPSLVTASEIPRPSTPGGELDDAVTEPQGNFTGFQPTPDSDTTQPSLVPISEIPQPFTPDVESDDEATEPQGSSASFQPIPDSDMTQPSLVNVPEIPQSSTPGVESDDAAIEPLGSSTSSQPTPDSDTRQPSLVTVSEIPQPSTPGGESDDAVTDPQESSISTQSTPDSNTTQPSLVSEIPQPSTPGVESDDAATEPQGSSASSQPTPDGDTPQPELVTISEIPESSTPLIDSRYATTLVSIDTDSSLSSDSQVTEFPDGPEVSTAGVYRPTEYPTGTFDTEASTRQPTVTVFEILGPSTPGGESGYATTIGSTEIQGYSIPSQPTPDDDTAQPSIVTISEIPVHSTPGVESHDAMTESQGFSTSSQPTPDGDTAQPELVTISEIPGPSTPLIDSRDATTLVSVDRGSSVSPDSDTARPQEYSTKGPTGLGLPTTSAPNEIFETVTYPTKTPSSETTTEASLGTHVPESPTQDTTDHINPQGSSEATSETTTITVEISETQGYPKIISPEPEVVTELATAAPDTSEAQLYTNEPSPKPETVTELTSKSSDDSGSTSGSNTTPSFPTYPTKISTGVPENPSESSTPGETPGVSAGSYPQGPSETTTGSNAGEYTSGPGTHPSLGPSQTTLNPKPQEPKGTSPSDNEVTATGTDIDEDLKHPPHIHAIDVQCGKEMMTINIEFNREFNGVIYSKGYYHMPECRYVKENSKQTKFSFTVNLNMCGTEFINAFDTQGKSYLENVLVLQNELGIQEIWDTVRSVRCLWEGNLKEQLSVSLMVGMLTQEIVTFSGDTAMAKLDIVLGRGPFGQPANGLVKIGEPMTLVVSVSGDSGFDVQVKDCKATDSTGGNIVPLTDDDGCVLKQKLFGSFQKTRNTQNTGASIIAYAYFNAFKFPDVMDLMIECNIELCKTDCDICTEPNQQIEPARRRRRDLSTFNDTLHDGIMMGKHLRVVLPEDFATTQAVSQGYCLSTQHFMVVSFLLISLFAASCFLSCGMWFKLHRLQQKGF